MALVTMGFGWSDIGSAFKTAIELPFTLPTQAAIFGAKQVLPLVRDVAHEVGQDLAALRGAPPPPPPPPPGGAASSPGASAAPGGLSSVSSSLPIIIGGVAAAGLVVVALLMKRKKGRS